MKTQTYLSNTANLFSALGNPVRLRILMTIGTGEACVCHLENVLKKRQAYLSQQLMKLRESGLLETRREGKYIFYRLSDPALLDLVGSAAEIAGISPAEFESNARASYQPGCSCPQCKKVSRAAK